MKTRPILATFAAFLIASPLCHAQDSVFKCTSAAGVSFQSAPCDDGAVMVKISSPKNESAALIEEDDDVPAPAAKSATPRQALFSRSDSLAVGMTDMQILNNRRWGKPQRITRNREGRAWHEHWTYQTGANGGKQLHFVNGVLAEVENLDAPASANTVVASQSAPDTSASDAARLVNAPTMVSAAILSSR